ncbi:MAG: hypothetical protein IT212_07765 [Bacteroidia bacterium]|nr:hypothetical protein [Bacteroidia bacterium]
MIKFHYKPISAHIEQSGKPVKKVEMQHNRVTSASTFTYTASDFYGYLLMVAHFQSQLFFTELSFSLN